MPFDSEQLKAMADQEIIDWLDKGIGSGGRVSGSSRDAAAAHHLSIKELREQTADLHADAASQARSIERLTLVLVGLTLVLVVMTGVLVWIALG